MRNVEFLRLQNRISWKHFKLLNTQTYLETKTNIMLFPFMEWTFKMVI